MPLSRAAQLDRINERIAAGMAQQREREDHEAADERERKRKEKKKQVRRAVQQLGSVRDACTEQCSSVRTTSRTQDGRFARL